MTGKPAASHPWRSSYKQTKAIRPNERTCCKCGQPKPLIEFPVSGSGHRSTCRECHNAERRANPEDAERKRQRARDYYQTNPEKVIARNRRQRHRRMAREGRLPPPVPDRWWSAVRASIELGRSISFVVKRCANGTLRARKGINPTTGGYCWRIDPASVGELKRELGP